MITAVWHGRGAKSAEALLQRVARHAPDAVLNADLPDGSGVAIGARGRAVLSAQAVVLGLPTSIPHTFDDAAARDLRGAYALGAITADGLLLAKGLLGGCALYIRRFDDAVVASSQLSPLAALAPASVDVDVLASFVGCVPGGPYEGTVLREIRRIRCCENVVLGRRERRFRRTIPALVTKVTMRPEDAAEELWSTLRASVRRAIEGRSRVAVFAGGGVDSSALLAAAVAEARGAGDKEIIAVALDFAGPGDDRPYLRALANDLGIVPIRIPPAAGGPFLREALVLDGAPYVGAAFDVAGPLVAREHGADVVLSGNYGDELFEGHLASLGYDESLWRAAYLLARLRLPWPTTWKGRLFSYLIAPRLRPHVPPRVLRARMQRALSAQMPWAGERLKKRFRDAPSPAPFTPTTARERYENYAHHDRWCDAADTRAQIETRTGVARIDPFQDDPLVQFVATIPTRTLMHDNFHRGLLRLAMRGKVPEALRLRTDKAWFEPALAEVVQAGGGFDVLADLASCNELAGLGLVDPMKFRLAWERLQATPSSIDAAMLWTGVRMAVAAEAFLRSRHARSPERESEVSP